MGAEERQSRQTSKKRLKQGSRILIADYESTMTITVDVGC
jgi:hypothetical protein